MTLQELKDTGSATTVALVQQAYDLGVASVTGGFTQADIDNAVNAAKAAQKSAFLQLLQSEDADLLAKAQAM